MDTLLSALTLKCNRCEHEWLRRIAGTPKQCPHCKSKFWNKDRVRNLLEVVPGDTQKAADLYSRMLTAVRSAKARQERQKDARPDTGAGRGSAPASQPQNNPMLEKRKAGATVAEDRAQRVLRKTGPRKMDPRAKGKTAERKTR